MSDYHLLPFMHCSTKSYSRYTATEIIVSSVACINTQNKLMSHTRWLAAGKTACHRPEECQDCTYAWLL